MTFTRTVVSILAAATVAASLLATTGAGAHHIDGDGATGNGAATPGARFAAPLREAPARLRDSLVMRRQFPGHPGKADADAVHGGGGCNKNIDTTSTITGVVQVGDQDNHVCTSADIDSFVGANGRNYVIQAGGQEAAFIITDVEDPTSPVTDGPWYWPDANPYTPDVKAFDVVVGGETVVRNYAALALEGLSGSDPCGVVIIDVTDGTYQSTVSQTIGSDWCDVHNVFVDKDTAGLGQQIYLTADATDDMRILDISGGVLGGTPAAPVEIGAYKADTANSYVHDITVVDHGGTKGTRAYLAYWNTGLVVLDVNDPEYPVELIGPNDAGTATLNPAGFRNHHSYPTPDGDFVFIQDEFYDTAGDEPVQMWDIRYLDEQEYVFGPAYVDGIKLGADIAVNPAHNLEIREDLAPGRLYTGWYKLGLQAFDYTSSGFTRDNGEIDGVYHQAQTEGADAPYSGAWGVRLALIGGNIYIFQSDRRYGLVIDCQGDGNGTESCPGETADNQAPTADATTDTETPTVNTTINLVGLGSSDPDDDPLSYNWTAVKAPKRANYAIDHATNADTTFQTDRHGEYTFQLEVFDELVSDIAQLIISVAKSGGDGGGKPGGGGKNCTPDDTRRKCNR